ncbi:unnamed product [Ostreococcus tauri]|uniref:Unnamed product n=2 Tax=Ostreococcus tauri TaxID=70448 RepID=A0A090LZW6_OSTTA|nr:unnamed product [Ostreococcus tauri]CEF97560.1 unnamed product [Ostreococcus tauri]|eukprot:XP_003078755.2 unnamed product [Ostreococcus tauri]
MRNRPSTRDGGDAWDDDALVRAYNDAIARHGGAPSSADERQREESRRGASAAERREDDARGVDGATVPAFDPRSFEPRARRVGSPSSSPVRPPPPYYYAETSYGGDAYGRRPSYPPPPPPPPRGYDPYDAYGGYYARGDDWYGHFEDDFAAFSPFRRGRGPPPPARGPPPPSERSPRYHRSPPTARSPMGPPQIPPDMTDSAYDTARSYADDGYDPDELANLLLAWYYAGYYTGSFSRAPHAGADEPRR